MIPSTSLNESHNIPTEEANELTDQQHVDVTEIKGFEINNGLEDQIIANVSLPEKSVLTKNKPAQNSTTTRDKPASKLHKSAVQFDKPVTITTDGRNHATGRSNKSALLQRSERVEETKEISKQEEPNVHKDETIINESKSRALTNFLQGLTLITSNNFSPIILVGCSTVCAMPVTCNCTS